MEIDLASYGLGAVSLFPAIGRLEKLRGFYPSGFRTWFITLSTVFSLVVYLILILRFEDLRHYISPALSAWLALGALILYIAIHLGLKGRKLAGWPKGLLISLMLVLYVGSIALLTYTFNIIKQLQAYSVYRGVVVAGDNNSRLGGAELSFFFVNGSEKRFTADEKGEFLAIVKQEELSALEVTHGNPDRPDYCGNWIKDKIPTVNLIIERCPGGT